MALQTLVALYGEKEPSLATLIEKVQNKLAATNGVDFQEYDLRQVHATIVGLEDEPEGSRINRNFRSERSDERTMDVEGYREFIRTALREPLTIQVGGFHNRD